MIGDKVWPTVLLVGTSTIASIVIGLLIGIWSGWRRGTMIDYGSLGFTLFVYAMPEFWFGMLVLMAFAGGVGALPGDLPDRRVRNGRRRPHRLAHVFDVLNHMVLPFFVLTVAYLGEYALIMRNSLLDVMADDYVQTARAKGVQGESRSCGATSSRTRSYQHGPSRCSRSASSSEARSRSSTCSRGRGWDTSPSSRSRRRTMRCFQALFLIFSAAVIIANLIADITYMYLDPRE